LGFLAIVIRGIKKRDPLGTFLLFYAIGVHLSIAVQGWFYDHYFQLWLPVLAVLCEYIGVVIPGLFPRKSKILNWGTPLLILAVFLVWEWPFYRLSAEQWSRLKYGDEFIVTKKTGKDMAQLLSPSETFFAWGTYSGLYLYSKKSPPVGHIFNYPLLRGPFAERFSEKVLEDLIRHPPELFITTPWALQNGGGKMHPIPQWAIGRYRRFEWKDHRGSFDFFALKKGALEARIRQGNIGTFLE